MAYATATATPIAQIYGSHWICEPTDPSDRRAWEIRRRPDQEICLEDGEFQINGPNGIRRIGRLTGRTRRIRGINCPTINLYDIDTVVEMVGEMPVIIGRAGDKLPGTWWIYPNVLR